MIRDGEIADCMYFILRGKVDVLKEGVVIVTLEQGAHFGEMALAEGKPTIRSASACCKTPCSVGSLSIKNFNILCEYYPIFKSKIEEEVIERKQDLQNKTKQIEQSRLSSIVKQSPLRSSPIKFNKRKSRFSNKGSRQSAYE